MELALSRIPVLDDKGLVNAAVAGSQIKSRVEALCDRKVEIRIGHVTERAERYSIESRNGCRIFGTRS